MNRLISLLLVLMILLGTMSACASELDPEPTEPISWSVVEEVGRDGDEVHYRIHFSNEMTVDRYTEEVER